MFGTVSGAKNEGMTTQKEHFKPKSENRKKKFNTSKSPK